MKNPLHEALVDLVGLFNRPQLDQVLLKRAGVNLDRALFPLLIRIGMRGPIGVVELAEQVGRDHSTVSRQVAKLEELSLIERQAGQRDQRVKQAIATEAGRRVVEQISKARNSLYGEALADWSAHDKDELARLLRKLADAAMKLSAK
jgi:DNA-binding MarR family transcriptional regulator